MATASSSSGENFDPFERLQHQLEKAIFDKTGVFLQPGESVAILADVLPIADVHLSLMHAEAALGAANDRMV